MGQKKFTINLVYNVKWDLNNDLNQHTHKRTNILDRLVFPTDLGLGEKIALAIAHSYVMTGFIPLTSDLFPFFSSTSATLGPSFGHNSTGTATPAMDDSIGSPSSSPVLNLLASQVVGALNQSFHSLTTRRTPSPIN